VTMRVLIVDDEPPARDRLRRLLEELPDTECVGEAGTGEQALELARQAQPDVVLLDIRMPGMGGLEAARHLAALPEPPAVIFTTAYEQHALEAFDAEASGYLLKPIRRERLAAALERAQRPSRAQLARISEAAEARTHITARVRDQLKLIPVGGVSLETTADFIRSGASAVAVGSNLVKKNAIAGGRFEELTEVARSFVAEVARARDEPG